jgi:TP901 family phage tail tape measure protein
MANFTPAGIEYLVKNFSKGMSDLGKLDNAQQDLGKSATSVSGKFSNLGKGILGVAGIAGGAALTGVTALAGGLVAFGASAVKEGAEFTKAMSNVGAVSGATAGEFDALTASAEELGRTTKFTAIEAAEGMSFLAMAGFEVNDIIGAMPGVLNLAAAGNLELGRASDIVSNVLTGFGADVEETGQFVDVLTKTFTSSNTSLEQLGQAMKFVAPVAADLGLSVEETAAAMGTMGDAGIQASMAGTSFRKILLGLAAPTGKAKDLIEELGIEVFDAEGNMLPFPEVIGNVNDALKGMSQSQREATLNTLVGKTAIAGFSVLLNKGEDALSDFGQELEDSGGTAAEIAAKQLDNLSGDVTLLKSALSGLKIDVFRALEPLLRSVVGAGKDLLETFGPQLTSAFGAVTDTISDIISLGQKLFETFQTKGTSGLVEALGLTPATTELIKKISQSIQDLGNAIVSFFLPGIQDLSQGGLLDKINTGIEFLNENFEAFKGAVIGVGIALAGAGIVAILATIGSIIAAIGLPVIAIVAAAAALGAIWTSNWLGIRDIIVNAWERMQPIFQTIIEWFQTNIPVAVQTLTDIWNNNLLPAFLEVGKAIEENLFPLFNQLIEFFRAEGPGAVQVLSDIWDNVLLPALKAVGNFILNTLIPTWTKIIVLFIEEIPVGINRMVTVWNFLKDTFNTVSNFITGTLIPAFSNLITWIQDTLSNAVNVAIDLWNLFLIPIQAVSNFFNDNIIPVIQSVANFLDAVLGVALTAMAGLWENVLLPALETVWNFINANILPVFQTVKDVGDEAVGGVAQTIADIWNGVLLPAFQTTWDFIQDNILPIFNTLADVINTVVIEAINVLSSTIGEFIDTALENLEIGIGGIKTALTEVTSFFNDMAETVRSFELPPILQPGSPTPFEQGLRGITEALGSPIQTAIKKFRESLIDGFSIVQAQLDKIVGTITVMITKLFPELGLITEDTATEMAEAMQGVIDIIKRINVNITTLNTTLGTIGTKIGTINTAMSTLNTTLSTLNTTLGTLNTTLGTLATTISTTITNALNTFITGPLDSLKKKLGQTEDEADDLIDRLEDFDDAAGDIDVVTSALDRVVASLKEIVIQAGLADAALGELDIPTDLTTSSARNTLSTGSSFAGSSSTSNITNQTFNIFLNGSTGGMSDAQTALVIRQSIQGQLGTV